MHWFVELKRGTQRRIVLQVLRGCATSKVPRFQGTLGDKHAIKHYLTPYSLSDKVLRTWEVSQEPLASTKNKVQYILTQCGRCARVAYMQITLTAAGTNY